MMRDRSRKMFIFGSEGCPMACTVLIRIKYVLAAIFLKGLMTLNSLIVNIKLSNKHQRNLAKIILHVEIRRHL